jgi:predicted permease
MGAGLMIHSVAALLRVNPGFEPKGLVWVMFRYPSGVAQAEGQKEPWNKGMAERLRSLAGVESVAFLGYGGGWYYKVEGRKEVVDARGNRVDVGANNAFRTLRTPLLAGRFFDEADASPKAKTILVNQELARLAWPGESPLGKRIAHAETEDWLEVIGVVGNIKDWRLDKPPAPVFYEPYQRNLLSDQGPIFVMRFGGDPGSLAGPLRYLAKEMAPGAQAPSIHFPEQELHASTELRRICMWFLIAFGMVGLTLAALGVYGVLAYWVSQRTRELAIRMALGAQAHGVLGLVLARGGRLTAIGVSLGLGAAFALTRLLRSQLFGTSPTEPLVVAGALLVLGMVALVGCYLPARRATAIDPVVALRHE